MKAANPREHVTRLIEGSNHMGAYLYLKDAELDHDDYVELVGMLAGSVVDQLSRTRRDDRERIYYLRSILAWIMRDVPGLGTLYREQLRDAAGGAAGLLGSFSRGLRNAGDVASGRKSVSDGFQDAADDVRYNVEGAAEAVRSGEAGVRLNEFLHSAESSVRQGLDQLGDFFRTLNEQSEMERSAEARPAEPETDASENDSETAESQDDAAETERGE